MVMSDMRKNSKLDTARKVDIRCKPDWRITILLLQIRLRNVRSNTCSNHRSNNQRWRCRNYLVERVLDDHLTIGVRNSRKQVPYSRVSLLVNVLLPLGDGLGHA